MMGLNADQINDVFARARPSNTADYDLLTVPGADLRFAHLAMSRRGFPALLVPVPRIGSDATRLMHGVAISAAANVEFVRGAERWCCPAAVVECRDPQLLRTFAALVGAVVARLEVGPPPSFALVSSLLSEWERLLGRRQVLTAESELGLWGELWCLARSSRALIMLEGWCGPESERVDFFVDGLGLEVKVGRRQDVHFVSHVQVQEPLGNVAVIFMSMYAMIDPLRGRTLPELVREVADTLDDAASFEEKLAGVGYARDDEHLYTKRYVLPEAPRLYRRADVPRVRAADAGVSDLRYRVEMDREAAMSVDDSLSVTNVLGLNGPFAREYPCA